MLRQCRAYLVHVARKRPLRVGRFFVGGPYRPDRSGGFLGLEGPPTVSGVCGRSKRCSDGAWGGT